MNFRKIITAGTIIVALAVMITSCTSDNQPASEVPTETGKELKTEDMETSEIEITDMTPAGQTEKETDTETKDEAENTAKTEKNSEATETKVTKSVSDATGADDNFKTVRKRDFDETVNEEVSELAEIKSGIVSTQTVFDDGKLVIKLTKLDTKNSESDYELNFEVENKTDQNLKIIAENSLVNDYYMNFGSSDKAEADNKTEIKMIIYKSDLKKAGIETLQTLEFNLLIFDADTYEDYACSDTVIIPVSDNN